MNPESEIESEDVRYGLGRDKKIGRPRGEDELSSPWKLDRTWKKMDESKRAALVKAEARGRLASFGPSKTGTFAMVLLGNHHVVPRR